MPEFLPKRQCSKCLLPKPYDPALKPTRKASGFRGNVCWDCILKDQRAVRDTPEGKAKAIAAVRAYNAIPENKAKSIASQQRTYEKNPGYKNSKNNLWYAQNPGRRTFLSRKYQMAQLKRTPPWANLKAIAAIYAEASSKGLTVDHIVPLQSNLVSGLHVENNLQLLTKSENSAKSNKWVP